MEADQAAVLENTLRDLEKRNGHLNVGVLGAIAERDDPRPVGNVDLGLDAVGDGARLFFCGFRKYDGKFIAA